MPKTTYPLTPLGKQLAVLRIGHDETSLQMAKKLGISREYLTNIERGRWPLSRKLAGKIIDVYNPKQDLIDFMEEEVKEPRQTIKLTAKTDRQHEFLSLLSKRFHELNDHEILQFTQMLKSEISVHLAVVGKVS